MDLTLADLPFFSLLSKHVPLTLGKRKKRNPILVSSSWIYLGFAGILKKKLGLFAHDFLHDLLFFDVAFGDFFSEIESGI